MIQEKISTTTTNWPSQSAFYYLMKNGFILRMESPLNDGTIPVLVKANLLEPEAISPLTQDQANYRVAIFRDEILEYPEYQKRVFGFAQ